MMMGVTHELATQLCGSQAKAAEGTITDRSSGIAADVFQLPSPFHLLLDGQGLTPLVSPLKASLGISILHPPGRHDLRMCICMHEDAEQLMGQKVTTLMVRGRTFRCPLTSSS